VHHARTKTLHLVVAALAYAVAASGPKDDRLHGIKLELGKPWLTRTQHEEEQLLL
jgi:hypothetical protein